MESRNYYFFKPYDENQAKPPEESFGEILNEAYLHPFTWNARTTRKSFWISVLINTIITLLAIGLVIYAFSHNINPGLKWIDSIIAAVIYVWLFLVGLGQTVRRLHDVNYSGYWYWVSLIPVGSYFILYLTLQPSLQRPVKWGNYLYLDENGKSSNDYYTQTYKSEMDKSDIPVPSVIQIMKEHFFDCFKWNARSTRTSFWVGTFVSRLIYSLGIFILLFMVIMVSFVPVTSKAERIPKEYIIFLTFMAIVIAIFVVWAIIAQIGHTVRRLHDAGLNGWWFWIGFVPYVGDLLIDFLLFHPTVEKPVKWNKYLFDENDRI